MDVSLVDAALKEFIRARRQKIPRYIGLAFLANSMPRLEHLKRKLMQLLAPIEVWEGPGCNGAPEQPISRYDFCNAVFDVPHPNGLIIYLPEEWMLGWPDDEKRVFWSNLAATFGRNRVNVISALTPSNMVHLQNYFHRTEIDGQSCAILSSKYEQ